MGPPAWVGRLPPPPFTVLSGGSAGESPPRAPRHNRHGPKGSSSDGTRLSPAQPDASVAPTSRAPGVRWDSPFTPNSGTREGRRRGQVPGGQWGQAVVRACSWQSRVRLGTGRSLHPDASPPELQTQKTAASRLSRGVARLTYIGRVVLQERARERTTACRGRTREPRHPPEAALGSGPRDTGSACLPRVSPARTPTPARPAGCHRPWGAQKRYRLKIPNGRTWGGQRPTL